MVKSRRLPVQEHSHALMYCCTTMYCRFPTALPANVPTYCVAVLIARVQIRQNLLRFPYIVDVSATFGIALVVTSRDHRWRPTLATVEASVSNCLRVRLLHFIYKVLNKASTIPKQLCRYHSDTFIIQPFSHLTIYLPIYLPNHLRNALFWVITLRILVIPCRRFGTTYRSHLQRSRTQSSFTIEDGTDRLSRNVGKDLKVFT